MSWAIARPGALVEAFVPGIVAWARRTAAHAVQPAVVSDPPAENACTRIVPAEVLEAFRLRPEAEKPLLDAGMPPDGSPIYNSRKRAADTPEDAARKFVMWARVVSATGTYSTRTICALYWECADVDHREPVADDRFLHALKSAPGIRKDQSATDRRRRMWIIEPAPAAPIVKPQPVAAQKAVAKPPLNHPRLQRPFASEQEYASPQLLHATAHEARRRGRARKQRGSRTLRWAA